MTKIILTKRDFERFIKLCENHPDPNEAMKKAAKMYKEKIIRAKHLEIKEIGVL